MTVFANSIMEVMQKANNVNNQSTKTVTSRSMNKEPERTIYGYGYGYVYTEFQKITQGTFHVVYFNAELKANYWIEERWNGLTDDGLQT